MPEVLHQQLRQMIRLSEAEIESFIRLFTIRHLKKGENLLIPGEICRHLFFIRSGCIRYYYTSDNGEEHTGQFFFENGWYTDFESYLTGKPGTQTIEAIEASVIMQLAKTDIDRLYDENPLFERFGRLMIEQGFLAVKRRNASFLNESPEERYLELMRTRPKVVERVALHHIASYLGIKPESLSRIRKRLQMQDSGS
ncbi:MAG: Crp/Fnr family transcriptional regulator [Bacteroidetes bacterium]|nr:MAG: Crp/Fnr family transcriptional regulator [Bacteroidota bacterium]